MVGLIGYAPLAAPYPCRFILEACVGSMCPAAISLSPVRHFPIPLQCPWFGVVVDGVEVVVEVDSLLPL